MNRTLIPPGSQDVISKLMSGMMDIGSSSIRIQVESFCSCLSEAIVGHHIVRRLPEFYMIHDDDEFYLEWIFDRFRFGFDFDEDPRLSGWFVLMKCGNGMFSFNAGFGGNHVDAVDCVLRIIGRMT